MRAQSIWEVRTVKFGSTPFRSRSVCQHHKTPSSNRVWGITHFNSRFFFTTISFRSQIKVERRLDWSPFWVKFKFFCELSQPLHGNPLPGPPVIISIHPNPVQIKGPLRTSPVMSNHPHRLQMKASHPGSTCDHGYLCPPPFHFKTSFPSSTYDLENWSCMLKQYSLATNSCIFYVEFLNLGLSYVLLMRLRKVYTAQGHGV